MTANLGYRFLGKRWQVVNPATSQVVTPDNLPAPNARWTKANKAMVVAATETGLLSIPQLHQQYGITVEEYLSWRRVMIDGNLGGLNVTKRQRRQISSTSSSRDA